MGEHLYSRRRLGGAVSHAATELDDITVAAAGAAAAAAGSFTAQRAQAETWDKQERHEVTNEQDTTLHSQLLVTVPNFQNKVHVNRNAFIITDWWCYCNGQ